MTGVRVKIASGISVVKVVLITKKTLFSNQGKHPKMKVYLPP